MLTVLTVVERFQLCRGAGPRQYTGFVHTSAWGGRPAKEPPGTRRWPRPTCAANLWLPEGTLLWDGVGLYARADPADLRALLVTGPFPQ